MFNDREAVIFLLFPRTKSKDPIGFINQHINELNTGLLYKTQQQLDKYINENTLDGPITLKLEVPNIAQNIFQIELVKYVTTINDIPVSFENNHFCKTEKNGFKHGN